VDLGTLSGPKFDRVWLKVQWRVHQEALALLLRAAICGDVPEIRALAQATLPAITRHLAELRAALAAFPGHHGDDDHGDHDHGDDDHGDHDHGDDDHGDDDNGKHRGHSQGKGHFQHGNGHGYGHKHHQHA
jgi:hypothetical protein